MRTFSGTQVLALLSVEDSFQFPFPTREEAEVACCLPGDGFRSLAVRGTAVHEQPFAGDWDYFFFFFNRKQQNTDFAVATSLMLSSCTCFMQTCLFIELAF